MDSALIGIHTSKGKEKSIHLAISKSCTKYAPWTQIFVVGPRTPEPCKIDIPELWKLGKKYSIFVHEPYACNMWKDVNSILTTIEISHSIGSAGVVVHLPKKSPDVVVGQLVKLMAVLDEKNIDTPIILETPSNKPDPLMSYETSEKLNRLIGMLEDKDILSDRVSICIDTAHVYIAGAPVVDYEDAKIYLNSISPGWIRLFHLNGNVYEFGKRFGDKHAIPFADDDQIWGVKKISYDKSGCRAFMEYSMENNIPVIFEGKASHKASDIAKFINNINSAKVSK